MNQTEKTKQVKFYYSEPIQLRTVPMITDGSGEPLFIYDKVGATIKNYPRVTVASCYDPSLNTMTFGVAVCSPQDHFVKSIGRTLAEDRANSHPEKIVCGIHRNEIAKTSKKYAEELIKKHLLRHHVHVDI